MSYCVNCGVELDASLDRCPLCQTEVINPAKPPRTGKRSYPYPSRIEKISDHIDKKFLVSIAGVIMLIPAIVTLFCDLIAGGGVSWSIYVIGALALLFVCIFVPMLFREPSVLLCMLFDGAMTAVYVFVICLISGGNWFWRLGLPIVFVTCAVVIGVAALFGNRKQPGLLMRVAYVLFGIAVLAVSIDLVICAYLGLSLIPSWSGYVFVPCALLGVCTLLLRRKRNFKEEIHRRFFI